jgi:beta propeller repeat protein
MTPSNKISPNYQHTVVLKPKGNTAQKIQKNGSKQRYYYSIQEPSPQPPPIVEQNIPPHIHTRDVSNQKNYNNTVNPGTDLLVRFGIDSGPGRMVTRLLVTLLLFQPVYVALGMELEETDTNQSAVTESVTDEEDTETQEVTDEETNSSEILNQAENQNITETTDDEASEQTQETDTEENTTQTEMSSEGGTTEQVSEDTETDEDITENIDEESEDTQTEDATETDGTDEDMQENTEADTGDTQDDSPDDDADTSGGGGGSSSSDDESTDDEEGEETEDTGTSEHEDTEEDDDTASTEDGDTTSTTDEVDDDATTSSQDTTDITEDRNISQNQTNKYVFGEGDCTLVSDGEFYCVAEGPERQQMTGDPRVYAQKDREGDKEIYYFDGVEVIRITNNSYDDFAPMYDEETRRIVWQSMISDRLQIMIHELPTNVTRQITTSRQNSSNPSISEDTVVWQEWIDTNWEIMMTDVDNNGQAYEIERLTDNAIHDMFPAAYNGLITWQSERGSSWEVIVYDMHTGKQHALEKDEGTKYENPRFVLLFDSKHDNGDIETVGYDLDTGEMMELGTKSNPIPTVPVTPKDETPEALYREATSTSQLKLEQDGDDDGDGNDGDAVVL